MKRINNTRGMTLLEVLVALVIFATAAVSVIRSVTQHINTLSYLEEKTFASIVADNQMAKVMLGKAPTSEKKGKTEMVGKTWYWKVVPVKTSIGLIKAVDVVVTEDSQYKHSLVTVRSYVTP
ncbi:type II secretion system minor pseudopilin GspI [Vibrio sp. SCSIO 43136]|uniref:type II secretion system minor pseudopilin GspI n=1 Tax=Vibrio sp. SCSIO 43136 TaxID=2819101 RepID=UPI0020753F4B|nr:type II secretion system minor pseudopilin GspI [Vibrio sp. SCSIO 43136]USD65184.1 type II secretion system minor pseudopilin GspI [Vibrio sp. SCSIO 43136]